MNEGPKFIEVSKEDLKPQVIEPDYAQTYSKGMYVKVNAFNRNEIEYQEYVRADKYYEALDILNKIITNKQRLTELEEIACTVLLES